MGILAAQMVMKMEVIYGRKLPLPAFIRLLYILIGTHKLYESQTLFLQKYAYGRGGFSDLEKVFKILDKMLGARPLGSNMQTQYGCKS